MRAPLWAVLSLGTSIVIALAIGDTLFFASTEYLGVTRALTIGIANPVLTTIFGIASSGGHHADPGERHRLRAVRPVPHCNGAGARERRAPARLPGGCAWPVWPRSPGP